MNCFFVWECSALYTSSPSYRSTSVYCPTLEGALLWDDFGEGFLVPGKGDRPVVGGCGTWGAGLRLATLSGGSSRSLLRHRWELVLIISVLVCKWTRKASNVWFGPGAKLLQDELKPAWNVELDHNCTIKKESHWQCNLLTTLLLSASFEFVGSVLPSSPISRWLHWQPGSQMIDWFLLKCSCHAALWKRQGLCVNPLKSPSYPVVMKLYRLYKR